MYNYEVLDVVLMSAGGRVGLFGTPKTRPGGPGRGTRSSASASRTWATAPTRSISGGEQQLVLIARAIAQNARTIIMDEPTSALDYGNTVRVLSVRAASWPARA